MRRLAPFERAIRRARCQTARTGGSPRSRLSTQLLLWFSFFRLPVPLSAGAIGTTWLKGMRNDVATFINTFIIGRLTVALAAYFIVRAVLDATEGGHPLGSVLASMFLLAIPTTATLMTSLETASRFSAADVL